MALNKEIWVNDIKEQLLPDNSFVKKGTDYSAFADAKTIHIPVALQNVNVEVDRTVLPAQVKRVADTEQTIEMHHFTSDPIALFNPEDVELSYDKRRVIVQQIADAINESVAQHALKYLTSKVLLGKSVLAALRTAAYKFDKGNYPESDRYVLLDAEGYAKLLKELTEIQTNAFLASANAQTGVIGQLFGLNILKRSTVGNEIHAVAWHKRDYAFALGPVQVYAEENKAAYYGSVLSASVRFGTYYAPEADWDSSMEIPVTIEN